MAKKGYQPTGRLKKQMADKKEFKKLQEKYKRTIMSGYQIMQISDMAMTQLKDASANMVQIAINNGVFDKISDVNEMIVNVINEFKCYVEETKKLLDTKLKYMDDEKHNKIESNIKMFQPKLNEMNKQFEIIKNILKDIEEKETEEEK